MLSKLLYFYSLQIKYVFLQRMEEMGVFNTLDDEMVCPACADTAFIRQFPAVQGDFPFHITSVYCGCLNSNSGHLFAYQNEKTSTKPL